MEGFRKGVTDLLGCMSSGSDCSEEGTPFRPPRLLEGAGMVGIGMLGSERRSGDSLISICPQTLPGLAVSVV